MHVLQKYNAAFLWVEHCQRAFGKFKAALASAPVLALPRDDGNFMLNADTSDTATRAVLCQVQDGVEKPIAYASRLYSDAERNYCVMRKELVAVVFFVKQFKQYLLGRHFMVRTDYSALQWLRRTPEPFGQQGRWLEILEGFSSQVTVVQKKTLEC